MPSSHPTPFSIVLYQLNSGRMEAILGDWEGQGIKPPGRVWSTSLAGSVLPPTLSLIHI